MGSYFKSRRGLRQGDPLSPLLFDIAADALAQILKTAVHNKNIEGLAGGWLKGGVVCLQYADDTLVFLKKEIEMIKRFKLIVICFELVSGLKINFDKSELFELGEATDRFQNMVGIMGCRKGEMPFKYLGIPLGEDNLKVED